MLFIAVGVLLILQHEPVDSEAYSLLVRTGISYRLSSFISLIIVSAAVFIISQFTAFKKWQKILIVLSGGFFYFPSVHASFGIATFNWGAKADYWEFSKQLNESLYGVLIPIFELGLAFLLIYLCARYLKLFFAAVLTICGYLLLLYFAAPLPLSGEATAPLLALMVLFIALTFSAKRRGRNRLDQIFGRLETYKLIKAHTSVRSLCLIPVILSVPHAVFSAISDLTGEVSDAYTISSQINQLPENTVILPASPTVRSELELYAPLLDASHEIHSSTVNDENLDDTISELAGKRIYIALRINACGESADNIALDKNWNLTELATSKNALKLALVSGAPD
ncbi:hypothetical protein IJJ18_03185 [Candidatus Saccharibacteria bacterium]|nr:hypothetical protein [Candidatus Saccharibacteria bacterium]